MPGIPSQTSIPRSVADLCRFRGSPQDLPWSPALLGLLIVAGTLLDLQSGAVFGGAGDALAHSLLSTGVVLALCWIALSICGLRNRFMQTATALFACSLVFSLLQWPIALWIAPPATGAAAGEVRALPPLQLLLRWMLLAVFIWQIAVDAQIMRKALDASLALAVALMVSWVLAVWALDRVVFGV